MLLEGVVYCIHSFDLGPPHATSVRHCGQIKAAGQWRDALKPQRRLVVRGKRRASSARHESGILASSSALRRCPRNLPSCVTACISPLSYAISRVVLLRDASRTVRGSWSSRDACLMARERDDRHTRAVRRQSSARTTGIHWSVYGEKHRRNLDPIKQETLAPYGDTAAAGCHTLLL